MIIKDVLKHHMGGGLMVNELLVEGHKTLKSITITDEYMVGYNVVWWEQEHPDDYENEVAWVVDGDETLDCIPNEIKDRVVAEYYVYLKENKINYNMFKGDE